MLRIEALFLSHSSIVKYFLVVLDNTLKSTAAKFHAEIQFFLFKLTSKVASLTATPFQIPFTDLCVPPKSNTSS